MWPEQKSVTQPLCKDYTVRAPLLIALFPAFTGPKGGGGMVPEVRYTIPVLTSSSGHRSGRYASYLNAFLFTLSFISIKYNLNLIINY